MDTNHKQTITDSELLTTNRGDSSQDVQGDSLSQSNEVLPRYYAIPQTDSFQRSAEDLLGETLAGSRTDARANRPGRLRCLGVDGHRLGSHARAYPVRGEAEAGMDLPRVASSYRGGDCPRESLGQQEEEQIVTERCARKSRWALKRHGRMSRNAGGCFA
jgi:hypothetical protein